MSLRLGLNEILPYIKVSGGGVSRFSTIDDLINKIHDLTSMDNFFVQLESGTLGYIIGTISGLTIENWMYVKSFTTDNVVNCYISNTSNLSYKVGDIVVLNPYKDNITVAKGTSYGYGMKNAELAYVGEMDTASESAPEFKSITEWAEYALSLDRGTITTEKYITFGRVTKIDTAWNSSYGNISFTMTDGNATLACYRASGEIGATIEVGDYILIYGVVQNYNGGSNSSTPEIKLKLPKEELGSGVELKTLDEVYEIFTTLATGQTTPDEYYSYGKVETIKTKYNEKYDRITVTFLTSNGDYIEAFRLSGGADIEVGDEILIKGLIQNYNGVCEFPAKTELIKVFKTSAGGGGSLANSIISRKVTSLSADQLEGLIEIGSYAFNEYSNLTSINMPNTVTKIGKYAFSHCINLANITLSNSIKNIDSNTFYYCSLLENISIPDTVTEIGNYAFGYSGLTTITIPQNVNDIGTYAFSNCTSLAQATILGQIQYIRSYLFNGCAALQSVSLPNSVTYISSYAFQGCNSLSDIDLPDAITTIESRAFANCTSLTQITVPPLVTTISNYLFSNCTSLHTITIPAGVTNINIAAFSGCTALENINFLGTIAQWENIAKGNNWNKNVPATVIHCADGDYSL